MDIDGGKLKQLREERGMSLRTLAGLAGMDASAVSLIERGKRRPHATSVKALADALGVAVGELRTEGGERGAFVAGYMIGGGYPDSLRHYAESAYETWRASDDGV